MYRVLDIHWQAETTERVSLAYSDSTHALWLARTWVQHR